MFRFQLSIIILTLFVPLGIMAQSNHFLVDEINDLIETEKKTAYFKNNKTNNLTNTYNVTYYKIALKINPSERYVDGAVTIHFIPHQNINQIVFDLSDALTVDSVISQMPGTFSHSQNMVFYNRNFTSGILDSVTIYYQGIPDVSSSSFVQSSHNGFPIVWTLSEPYGALDWWPCKQSLTDKADSINMFITTPLGYKVAGNGSLVSVITYGSSQTTHWNNSYPIVAYLVAFAVTNYAEISFYTNLSTGNLFVQNYVYPEDSAKVISDLNATKDLLHLYDSIIGPYPFMTEKYGHAQFGRGGGMEHQTMSFMNHFGFGLTAHELAHQWFGDKITCGSWSDLWLNEGFATYFTGIAYENLTSDSLWQEWKRLTLNEVVSEPNGTVFVIDTTNVARLFDSRLTYRKGAYVLHMLRNQIGNHNFYAAIKEYVSDTKLAYGTATTEDFFYHVQNNTSIDLTNFFNEWIYQEGYPSYNIEWDQQPDGVEMVINQTTSHPSVTLFHLYVPILLTNNKGDSLMIRFWQNENSFQTKINVDFEVQHIIVDPNLDIISKSNVVINRSSISEFSVYPIPTSDILYINPGIHSGEIKKYSVFSANGTLVYYEPEFIPFQNSTINVSNFPQGVYTIVFKGDLETIVQKFMVSR